MITVLRRKLKTASDLVAYQHAQISRATANRAIAEVSRLTTAKSSGAILCEAFWDNPHHWLRLAMFRVATAEDFGASVIGVYEEKTGPRVVDSLRALPLTAEECVATSVPQRYADAATRLLQGVTTPRQFLELRLPHGYPAHSLYDGVLKEAMLGGMDVTEPRVLAHVAKALHYLDIFDAILSRHPVRAVVVSHPTTTRFSALVWAALRKNIPVFVLNYLNRHITIRRMTSPAEMLGAPNDYPTQADRDRLSQTNRQHLAKKGRAFLNLVTTAKAGEVSMVGGFGKGRKGYASKAAFLAAAGADRAKPNVVILTNCWPDLPNTQGATWFADYVEWFEITLAATRQFPQYNWYLKAHPAEHLYGNKVTLRQLAGENLPPGIFYWPEGAFGTDAMAYMDCVVTAAGTAGIEYPAAGRRALVARETLYTPWGFVNFARSRDEYIEKLKTAAELPLPDERQKDDAAIFDALYRADPDEASGRLLLPYGLLSYRLWPEIPAFITENRDVIRYEIDLMRSWIRSRSPSYNVYAVLAEIGASPA